MLFKCMPAIFVGVHFLYMKVELNKGEIEILVLLVFPFGARIVAQGIVPVNVGGEKTGNISTESNS